MPKQKQKPSMMDLLSTGQFGAEVGRTSKCVRDWIQNETIPPEAVEFIAGQYRIRRWAIEEVKAQS